MKFENIGSLKVRSPIKVGGVVVGRVDSIYLDKEDYLPDFKGKCISITIMDDDDSHDLFDPRFEYQGGRLFIIGTVPKGATQSDWVLGFTSEVAWDRVTDYFVFDDKKSYEKAVKISKEYTNDQTES